MESRLNKYMMEEFVNFLAVCYIDKTTYYFIKL